MYFAKTIFVSSEGFKEAAEKFQQESGINPSINLDTMDNRIKIRDAIQNGRIEEAITLVNQLHPELLDNDRHLYFHLQVMYYNWNQTIGILTAVLMLTMAYSNCN